MLALGQRAFGVGGHDDLEPLAIDDEPDPAAAEHPGTRLDELRLEGVDAAGAGVDHAVRPDAPLRAKPDQLFPNRALAAFRQFDLASPDRESHFSVATL